MPGPIGPPGFNASQGAAGSTGAGNFGSCQYKVQPGDKVDGAFRALASKTEPTVSTSDNYVFCFQTEIRCIFFEMPRCH